MTKPAGEFNAIVTHSDSVVHQVGKTLTYLGYKIEIPNLVLSPTVEDRWKYTDDGDIYLIKRNGKERIEVKYSYKLDFFSEDQFPYTFVIIDEKYKIDKPHKYPLNCYISVNKSRTGCLRIPASTRDNWIVREGVPDSREIRLADQYLVHRALTKFFWLLPPD